MQPCMRNGIFVFQERDTGAIQISTKQNVQKASLNKRKCEREKPAITQKKIQEKSGS